MTKIITIGSATMDVFVESDEANIVSVCTKDKNSDFMSYPYGSKIDITTFASNVGGGGVNTACNFGNLGFDTSAIFKIGKDFYADGIFDFFRYCFDIHWMFCICNLYYFRKISSVH